MNNKSFISGLEELVARIVSLFITTLLFAVYSYATSEITIDWQSSISYLVIFWLLYESFSYILYLIFKFFGDNTPKNDSGLTIPVDDNDDSEGGLPANVAMQPTPVVE